MKKLFLYILLLSGLAGHAQFGTNVFGRDPIINLENFDKQRVHWGYFLGFNSYDFKFDYKANPGIDIQVKQTTGFNVGLVGNLRLFEYLDLRFEPGLYYTQRNLIYHQEGLVDNEREVKSTYIHFPLLLKFSSKRTGNVRPYLVGGFSRSWNLGSNEDARDDNMTGGNFRMKTWTNNYELGVGVDLYFEYFKFSPSIRGVFSLDDEIIRDTDPNSPYTGNVGSMKTRGIFVNFTFH
ncbi:PorT family protein [Flavobacterium sp. MFBS3-15]|uniref:type IX secretion/gliding motility protein PorT/SprT n=1 Tax=Flavobacterium sp. MFBS3-15 TaxID=2989816 RepID=UPI002236B8CB|nr:porin family protein [Flavobacterium sp. MFBS3-15]MCW4468727.1 PorT family protein [Flavobacterium sp. MFBS3-15]